MLSLRRRGRAGNWYVRGSVTLGDRSIDVAEFSTGTSDEDAARHLMGEGVRELREELMFGPRVVLARAAIADAFETYLSKPKRPNSSDILRVGVMNERIGGLALSDPKAAWRTFQDAYLAGHAPAGQDRYRSLLQVCINVWQERHDLPPVKIKAIAFDNQRIRFLSHAERDRLIGLYAPHVQPIATMFAFQGPRTQGHCSYNGGQGASISSAARSFSREPRPAIRARWRFTRGSRRWSGRSGRSAAGQTLATSSLTDWDHPIPIPAISRSRVEIR